jgi:hypothetical protein
VGELGRIGAPEISGSPVGSRVAPPAAAVRAPAMGRTSRTKFGTRTSPPPGSRKVFGAGMRIRPIVAILRGLSDSSG